MYQSELDDNTRARQIRHALSYYDEHFTKYLASAIAFSEQIPEEINNQIRNAFTHLARAQEATDQRTFQEEIEKCIGHIERGSRDCLKASIIVARDQLESMISDAVFYYVTLTPDLKARYKEIVNLRREVYRAETRGERGINEKLELILRETIHLQDLIKERYREVGTKKAKILRFAHRWSHPAYTLVALAIGYIARPYVAMLVNWLQSLVS